MPSRVPRRMLSRSCSVRRGMRASVVEGSSGTIPRLRLVRLRIGIPPIVPRRIPVPDSDTPHDLALINEATAKLKTAQSLDEVWAVHGIARAAHLAARRRGSRRAVAAANVIRFDAERRLGE